MLVQFLFVRSLNARKPYNEAFWDAEWMNIKGRTTIVVVTKNKEGEWERCALRELSLVNAALVTRARLNKKRSSWAAQTYMLDTLMLLPAYRIKLGCFGWLHLFEWARVSTKNPSTQCLLKVSTTHRTREIVVVCETKDAHIVRLAFTQCWTKAQS